MNNEELLEKIQEKIKEEMDITREELFKRMDDKIDKNNEKLFKRMDDKMEENNEKLLKKMQKQMKKDKKELKDQMDAMQKENLEFQEEMREFQKGIQEQIHIVKDVNLPCILEQVTKTRKDLKQTEKRLEEKLDQYIEGHAVEHKKIDYELSNIKWKTKVAN